MTDEQRRMALALRTATMCPGIGTKRFARDMAARAEIEQAKGVDHPLTPAQARYLATAVVRFRRQLPADVVELARQAAELLQRTEL